MPVLSLAAIGLLAAAAATDARARRIPNGLVLGLLVVGFARIAAEIAGGGGLAGPGVDLAAAAALFAAGAALFAAGLLGGGDVKLISAAAVWLGAAGLGTFLATTAVAGGLLALVYAARRHLARRRGGAEPSLPYGIAIAAGGIGATLGAL